MYLQSLWLLNQRVNEFSLYRACPMSPRAGAQIPDMRSNRGNSVLARDLVVCLVGEDAGSPTFFVRCNLIGVMTRRIFRYPFVRILSSGRGTQKLDNVHIALVYLPFWELVIASSRPSRPRASR